VFIRINNKKALNFNFKFELIIKDILFEIFVFNTAAQNDYFEYKKNMFITKIYIIRIAVSLSNIL